MFSFHTCGVNIFRLNIPNYLLPSTNHPTTLSVIHSDNHTIMNVLVDMVGTSQ